MRILPFVRRPSWWPVLVWAASFCSLFLASPTVAADETSVIACATCRGTGACQAKGCKEGKTPCPATCLKKDAPGWTTKKIDGYPDGMLWMVFEYRDEAGKKKWQAYSQHHVGELIEFEKGQPVNRGRCPKCEGSSRVTCATCKGDAKCKTCGGSGKIAVGGEKLTLIDAQGRTLEAVVRARKADTITVMRLPDQAVFDIPLSKLSAESNELVNQRFPAPAR